MNTAPRNDNAPGQGCEVGKAEANNDSSFSTASAYEVKESPAFPSINTQPARLLAALLQRRRIHPLAGWQALGIYRLSDTVLQLRKLGWPVVTGRLDVNNRYGEPCHVALYSLPAEVIENFKEKCAKFIAEAQTERKAA